MQVVAKDNQGANGNADETTIVLNILDVNDEKPQFTQFPVS